jgi:O-antigen/teichoic acid export membrane protein
VSVAPPPSVNGIRSTGFVTLAIAVSSVGGYALLLACGRLLGPAQFAVFLAFWGVVFGLASALSPVEQEVARRSAVARATGRPSGIDVLHVVAVGLGFAALAGVVLLVPSFARKLLGGHGELAPLVAVTAVAFVAQFGLRGLLIGHGRVRAYAGLVAAEASLRLVGVGIVVVAGVAGIHSLAAAVAAGSLAWLALGVTARGLLVRQPSMRWDRAVVGHLGALVVASALTAAVITGYPALVVGLTPGEPDAALGALFAALTVSRIPLLAVAPLQALAIPAVVTMLARSGGARRVTLLLWQGLAVAAVCCFIGGVAGVVGGSGAVRLLYGGRYAVSGARVGALVVSAVVLAAILLACAVLVALRRYGSVTAVWAAVTGVVVVVLVVTGGDASTRAVRGLLLGPAVGLVLVLLSARRALAAISPVAPASAAQDRG